MLDTVNDDPPQSSDNLVFLGIGDGGQPLSLDFKKLLSGSLLVSSKSDRIETLIIQTMISSISHLFQPFNSELIVIAEHADKWTGHNIQQQPQIKTWEMANSTNLFLELAEETAKRMDGAKKEPAVFLFLDDLSKSLDMGYQIQETLMWLIFYGPKTKIWPIVILKDAHIAQFEDWLDLFDSLLLDDLKDQEAPTGTNPSITENPFRIYHLGKWRKFRIPG